MEKLNLDFVKSYLKVENGKDDLLIGTIIKAATSYVLNYTGLTLEEAKAIDEIEIAILLLIEQMYSVRSALVETDKINFALKTILDMNSGNLL